MKLTRLENITLHKLIKITLPDGERDDQPDEGVTYQALIQYLDDEVADEDIVYENEWEEDDLTVQDMEEKDLKIKELDIFHKRIKVYQLLAT